MKTLVERYPVLSFVVLAYAISWLVWFTIPLLAGQWALMKILIGIGLGPGLAAVFLARWQFNRQWWLSFGIVACAVTALGVWNLLAPDARDASELAQTRPVGLTFVGIAGAAALGIVCGFIFASAAQSRSPVLRTIAHWRTSLRWGLIALLLPLALLAVGALLSRESVGTVPANLSRATWLAYTIRSLLFTFVIVGIGEEVGWRGWLLPQFQKRFSPLNSSLILGVIWGAWHFPLFVIGAYPGGPESIVVYLFIGPMFAILFTWLFNRTHGALLPAICLHTAVNNSSRFVAETSLYPVLLIVFVVAVVIMDRMWKHPRSA